MGRREIDVWLSVSAGRPCGAGGGAVTRCRRPHSISAPARLRGWRGLAILRRDDAGPTLAAGMTPQGKAMSGKGNFPGDEAPSASMVGAAARTAEQSQLDFELDFYSRVLERYPDYVDMLRVHGNNLTLKGRYAEGLQIDRRLIALRPNDALAHYNLACSLALLKKVDQALTTLRRAIELGYRDFRYMAEDRDLDAVRRDPRFLKLLREFQKR